MAEQNIAKAEQFNWCNWWICFLVSLGQIAFGYVSTESIDRVASSLILLSQRRYPSAIIGTTLGEPSFLVYMGVLDAEEKALSPKGAQLVGAMSGVFQVKILVQLPTYKDC